MKSFKLLFLFAFLSLSLSVMPNTGLSNQKQTLNQIEHVDVGQPATRASIIFTRTQNWIAPSAYADASPAPAPAASAAPVATAPVINTPTDALGLLPTLLAAIKSDQWGVVAAVLLMLLLYLGKLFLFPELSSGWTAFLSAAVPVLSMLAAALFTGTPVLQSMVQALFLSAAASGFWSWVGSRLLPAPAVVAARRKAGK